MLPLHLFRDRTFATTSAAALVYAAGFFGGLFVLSIEFQDIQGHGPAAAGLLFGIVSVFFGATTFGPFGQSLRFLSGLYPCYFAGVHAFNFFFDRAEPRLSVAPQFFFLRAFSRFSFHVPAFLLRAIMCLLFFRLPQSSEFRLVGFGSSEHLRVNLGAARFFISAREGAARRW